MVSHWAVLASTRKASMIGVIATLSSVSFRMATKAPESKTASREMTLVRLLSSSLGVCISFGCPMVCPLSSGMCSFRTLILLNKKTFHSHRKERFVDQS